MGNIVLYICPLMQWPQAKFHLQVTTELCQSNETISYFCQLSIPNAQVTKAIKYHVHSVNYDNLTRMFPPTHVPLNAKVIRLTGVIGEV